MARRGAAVRSWSWDQVADVRVQSGRGGRVWVAVRLAGGERVRLLFASARWPWSFPPDAAVDGADALRGLAMAALVGLAGSRTS